MHLGYCLRVVLVYTGRASHIARSMRVQQFSSFTLMLQSLCAHVGNVGDVFVMGCCETRCEFRDYAKSDATGYEQGRKQQPCTATTTVRCLLFSLHRKSESEGLRASSSFNLEAVI